jgi:transcriptional regulator with XRE-family HTH domain
LTQRRSRHIQPGPGPEKAFGQALREIRQSREISQEKLALECNFDRTYISLIERGIQSPTVRNLVKLAEVLHVRPSVVIRKMERILAAASRLPAGGSGVGQAGKKTPKRPERPPASMPKPRPR